MISPVLFLAAYYLPLASAFSTGAGQCLVGAPSVGGSHLAGNTTTGTLESGGFQVFVRNTEMIDGGLATLAPAGFTYDLVVAGSRPFKGVTIVVTDVYRSSSLGDVVLIPGDNLQIAANCPDQLAVTHKNASPKDSVSVDLGSDEEVVAGIDVTVVVENTSGVSEYYHTNFRIQVLDVFISDFIDDCIGKLMQADSDKNMILDENEYFALITALGQGSKCYTPEATGGLTKTQKDTFETVACTICLRNGEDWTCCVNPTGLSIAGAESPDTATTLQHRHLSSICQYTYADIPPGCNLD